MCGRVFILHHSGMVLRRGISDRLAGNIFQKNIIKVNEGMYVCMCIFKTSDLIVLQYWS